MNIHERIKRLKEIHGELKQCKGKVQQDIFELKLTQKMSKYRNEIEELKLHIGSDLDEPGGSIYTDEWTRARIVEDSYYLFLPALIDKIQN